MQSELKSKDVTNLEDTQAAFISECAAFLKFDGNERQVRKRRTILEASSDLLGRYGYQKTTIDDILNGAGVSRGTLYAYYESKAEILVHACVYQKMVYYQNHASEFEHVVGSRSLLHLVIVQSIEMNYTIPVMRVILETESVEVRQFMSELYPPLHSSLLDYTYQRWADLIQSASTRKLKPKELKERTETLLLMLDSALAGHKLIPHRVPVRPHAERAASLLVSGVLD